jgi:UDP-glucose 4-epimerase
MKILVTGGAGFIGSHVVHQALVKGHEVAVLDDLSSGRAENVPKGVPLFKEDIRNAERTRYVFKEFGPSAVCHQAAQASVVVSMNRPALDGAVNVVGGLNVLEAAMENGVENFVFASTGGAIYGEVSEGAADESYPPSPISPYAIHKLAFEQLLWVYKNQGAIAPTVLRYANVYGPRQDPHGEAGVVAIFLDRARANQNLQINAMKEKGDDGCIRDYVFVSDVARANLLALEGGLSVPVLNVGTEQEIGTRDLAKTLLSLLPESTSQLTDGAPRAGDIGRSLLSARKYKSEIGPLVDLASGLKATLESLPE